MHVPLLLHQLLPLLYRGAGNSASWSAFLALLCDGLGARMAAVLACDDQHNLAFLQHSGMDGASQQACVDQFLQLSAEQQGAAPARSAAGTGGAVARDAERLLDGFHCADIVLGRLPGFSRAGLTVLRSNKSPAFHSDEIAFLQQLAPHLEGALLLQRQFALLRQGEGLIDRISRSFDLAYILLDRSGRPQGISPAAQALLAESGGLRLRNGQLHSDVARENLRLYQLLEAACLPPLTAPKAAVGETSMTISRPGLKKPLQIALQPLNTANDTSCAVLFLRDPGAQPGSRAAVLRQLYSLLPSEVRLAESLTDGLDVKHAALRMHITENSARTLLKGVFRKLEVNSQAGLIRTVLTLPAE